MKKTTLAFRFVAILGGALMYQNCKNEVPTVDVPEGATKIAATSQRTGDAAKGYNYLVTGDYISSGIPLDIYKAVFGASNEDLGRTGDNKGVPFSFNAFTASNGVKVVATTCLSCHADRLNGQVVVGLGNTTSDNTRDAAQQFNLLDAAVTIRYGGNSPEWKAYEPFSRGFKAIAPYIKTETQGVNPADKIFAALAAFRSGSDLKWLNTPQYNIPVRVVPSDVPAWWVLRKKNALYYNALGVGDLAKHLMTASILTVADTAEARKIDNNFADVYAYLKTIKAPQYPYPIDQTLVSKGKSIFDLNCAKCHGKYGAEESYPNYLIDLKNVGTDAALADEYPQNPAFHNWYNASWYAQSGKAQLKPTRGYIAPPLDGIWATAPYLHNGSVPTLEDLLNSPQRPKYWSRVFENTETNYDKVKIGWKYAVETSKKNVQTYDTTLYGYGNGGHYYGDKLSSDERKALIEYLKTL